MGRLPFPQALTVKGIAHLKKEQLLEFKRLKVDSLIVSIDSMAPAEHDTFRQKHGALAETLETINLAKKLGFSVVICVVIHRKNLYTKGVEDLLEFAKKENIIINFALGVPAGNWNDFKLFKKDFMLDKEDKLYARELIKKNYHARFDFALNLKKWGCPAATEKVYITPYGDVMPCPFIQISFGNIKKESIINIRQRMLEEKRVSEYFNQCLAAEDNEFMERYLIKTFNRKELPIPYGEVF